MSLDTRKVLTSCREEYKGRGGYPVHTDLEVDLLLPPLLEGEECHESLVHAPRGCCHCHFTPWPTLGVADILLSASPAVFLCPGDLPSPVTTLRRGGPVQRGGPGAAEDHQPASAAAGAAGLPLPPGQPGPPAPAIPALRHLRLHRDGQLLLQWPRRPLHPCRWIQAHQGSWGFPCGTYMHPTMSALQESRILKIVRDCIEYGVGPSMQYLTCNALDSKQSKQKWSLLRGWFPCEAEVLNFLCVLVWDSHPSKVLHSNLFISGKSSKIIKLLTPIFPQMLTCNNTVSKG